MANVDFSPPKVERGYLLNSSSGEQLEFHLNPTSIKQSNAYSLSEDAIPGYSDTLLRYASGVASTITFQLRLDGEVRNRARVRDVRDERFVGGGSGDPSLTDYSIASEIAFLESLTLPQSEEEPEPPRVVFYFGKRYPGLVVLVPFVDTEVTRWTPSLDPTTATVSVTLRRYVTERSRFAASAWRKR